MVAREECGRVVRDVAELPPDQDGDGRVSAAEFQGAFLRQVPFWGIRTDNSQARELEAARRLSLEGRWARALTRYEAVLERFPASPEGRLGAGRCLEMLGRDWEALAAYWGSIEIDRCLADSWLSLGLLELRYARWQEPGVGPPSLETRALDDLWTGLELLDLERRLTGGPVATAQELPLWRELVLGVVAGLRDGLKRPDLAGRVEDWARERFPPEPAAHEGRLQTSGRHLASRLVTLGRAAEALELLDRALRARPDDAQARLTRAAVLTALDRPREANRSLEEARKSGARGPALCCLTLGNQLDLGDRIGALRTMEELERLSPTPEDLQEAGWQLAFRGEWALAAEVFDRVRYRLPPTMRRRVTDAMALAALGSLESAVRMFEGSFEPELADLPTLRMVAELFVRAGQLPRALDLFATALGQHPETPAVWLELARLQDLSGQPADVRLTLQAGLAAINASLPGASELRDWLARLAGRSGSSDAVRVTSPALLPAEGPRAAPAERDARRTPR